MQYSSDDHIQHHDATLYVVSFQYMAMHGYDFLFLCFITSDKYWLI